MSKLEKFKEKLAEIYGDNHLKILDSIKTKPKQTFRLTDLSTPQTIKNIKLQGFILENIPKTNIFIVSNGSVSKTNEFNNGEIYIQNLSSILPVYLLDIQKNEKVLDLCASPGSKTEYIAELTNPHNITAIEKNKSRFYKLKWTLDKYKKQDVKTLNIDGKSFTAIYPTNTDFFDKVVVDVPCTGEGLISLNDKESIEKWNPKQAKKISKLQKGLLDSGFKALKNGGLLSYSTCTINIEENENVVEWFLNKNKNAEVVNIEDKVKNIIKNYTKGFSYYSDKTLHKSVSDSIRILPNGICIGFYTCIIKKIDGYRAGI